MVIEVKRTPKTARNYQRKGVSDLLAQMHHSEEQPKPKESQRKQENRAGIAAEAAQRQPDEQPGNAACLFFGRKANP